MQALNILKWYLEAGVDEAILEQSVNRFAVPSASGAEMEGNMTARMKKETPPPAGSTSLAAPPPSAAMAEARALADKAGSREELEQLVRGFNGCALKKMATNTVFCDGDPNAKVMVIGEAPGAQEDAQGIPFCGPSGMLLDKMLGAIGLERASNVYITNTLFWRPPGNRQPSKEELAICQPFVEKHIALMNPALLVLSGGTAVGALLRKDTGISRLRGRLHEYQNTYMEKPVPVAILFHPSYLLRSPGQKRLAWHDLLLIRQFLTEAGVFPPGA